MAVVRVFLMVGAIAVIVLALWAVLRRAPHGRSGVGIEVMRLSRSDRATARSHLRRQWQSSLIALLAGVAACAAMWQLAGAQPEWYGLPYALAGTVGAVVGLLVLNLIPPARWPSDDRRSRVGELSPRGSFSFARQWVFALPLSAAVLLVLSLVLTGLYSSTDESGLHRVFMRRSLSGWGVENGQVVDVQYNLSATSPFPGWYYGLPLIVGTVVFAVAVYWTLRRTAMAPRPISQELFAVDTAARTLRTRFVMVASSAALGFQIAGTGLVTGITLRSSHMDAVPTADGSAAAGQAAVEPGHTLAIVLILASLAIAIAALLLLLRAIRTVTEAMATGANAAELTTHEAP